MFAFLTLNLTRRGRWPQKFSPVLLISPGAMQESYIFWTRQSSCYSEPCSIDIHVFFSPNCVSKNIRRKRSQTPYTVAIFCANVSHEKALIVRRWLVLVQMGSNNFVKNRYRRHVGVISLLHSAGVTSQLYVCLQTVVCGNIHRRNTRE